MNKELRKKNIIEKFDIPQNIDIESLYWNETYLGDNRTINTSSFGNAFGV